ncbi:MAG: formate/nitrite transporter family protein [Clostridia bacterium]|nr:formate/nitrite transporter family protein [Clostridia bacterium]
MEKAYLSPREIAESTVQTGINKVKLSPLNQLILGILAGAFIAFAAEGSNMAAFNLFANSNTYGLGKVLAGAVFGVGLMLVIIAGGELFTGNILIVLSVLEKQVKIKDMLRNWTIVYIGNLIGSVLIAYMMARSGLFNSGANMLGAVTIKIAVYKVELSFLSAFYLGIMCNWLVCLAVWISYSAKDITGKILGVFFPIWLFVTSGFEHSIANMYYIPAGIIAKANASWAAASGLSIEKLNGLNWGTFIINNLIPVTLGNIVGGAFFVAGLYWMTYLKKKNIVSSQEGNF